MNKVKLNLKILVTVLIIIAGALYIFAYKYVPKDRIVNANVGNVDNGFYNVTGENNTFIDSPKIGLDSGSPGGVSIRVASSSGEQVGEVKKIAPGESIILNGMPAYIGYYTIQAKADTDENFNYKFYFASKDRLKAWLLGGYLTFSILACIIFYIRYRIVKKRSSLV